MKLEGPIKINMGPGPVTWSWCLAGNWIMRFNITGRRPNWFHRLTMRWFLGIHTRLVKSEREGR